MVNKPKNKLSDEEKELEEIINNFRFILEKSPNPIDSIKLINDNHEKIAKGIDYLKANGILKEKVGDETLVSALAYVAAVENLEDIELAIAKDKEILSIKNKDGSNPAFAIARYGSEEAQLALLAHPKLIDESDDANYSALSILLKNPKSDKVMEGIQNVLKELKEKGTKEAEPPEVLKDREILEQVFWFTRIEGHEDLVNLIKAKSEKLFETDSNGDSLAFKLITSQNEQALMAFFENKELLFEKADRGNTIGYMLAIYGSEKPRLELAKDNDLLMLEGKTGDTVARVLSRRGPESVYAELLKHTDILEIPIQTKINGQEKHESAADVFKKFAPKQFSEALESKENEAVSKDIELERKWQKDAKRWINEFNDYVTKNPWAKAATQDIAEKYADKLENKTLSLREALELYYAVQKAKSLHVPTNSRLHKYLNREKMDDLSSPEIMLSNPKYRIGKRLSNLVDDAHEMYKRDLLCAMFSSKEVEEHIKINMKRYAKFQAFDTESSAYHLQTRGIFSRLEKRIGITEMDWDWLYFAIKSRKTFSVSDLEDNLRAPLRGMEEETADLEDNLRAPLRGMEEDNTN